MEKDPEPMLVAADGGGTRLRLAVRDRTATIAVEAGPANVSTDFDGAVRAVLEGLDALAAASGRQVGELVACPAFLGLAGITGEVLATRLGAALPFRRAVIRDDRPAALRGALGTGDGFLAHCGTGSFFGAQTGGAMRLAGGWGAVLGDEASAQWVGRRILALALDSADGLVPASPLATDLLRQFEGPPGIVRFAARADPGAFGALAPRVTEHASRGDALALSVMHAAAAHIETVLRNLGWSAGERICLTGGIGPLFATHLPEPLRSCLAPPRATPLEGALALALDTARRHAESTP